MERPKRKLHPEGSLLFQANPLIPDPTWEANQGISFLELLYLVGLIKKDCKVVLKKCLVNIHYGVLN